MDEEEMRRRSEREGKKSRVRWCYGGLPVFGAGWEGKVPGTWPSCRPFLGTDSLTAGPGKIRPERCSDK